MLAKGNYWIRLSRNTGKLGTGCLGPLGGVNRLSNAWGARAFTKLV